MYNAAVAQVPAKTSPTIIDPDRQLVHAARNGDFDAFEKLVSRYERPIYALAMRITLRREDAQDVAQETFLSVVEHLADFREGSTFYTWLVRIATNHALKVLRKRRGLPMVALEVQDAEDDTPLPHPDFIAQWKDEPSTIAQDHETQRLLDEALAEIEEKYRLVFILRDVEGLSTEETARIMGISVANAKVRLLRARLMLREKLTQAFGDKSKRLPPHKH